MPQTPLSPDILFQDSHILVCRKPAGLPVQTKNLTQPDLETMLKTMLSEKESRPSLYVVHRLDTHVEGVLVFARTKEAAASLNRQIAGGKMQKIYRAVLNGIPENDSGELTHYMKKDSAKNIAVICPKNDPKAKKAVLRYRIVEKSQMYSKAEITLITGRFHQIRLQFQTIGHPLAGDRKYCSGDDIKTPHIMLLAVSLRFFHPADGREMSFSIPDTLRLPG